MPCGEAFGEAGVWAGVLCGFLADGLEAGGAACEEADEGEDAGGHPCECVIEPGCAFAEAFIAFVSVTDERVEGIGGAEQQGTGHSE